MTAVVKPYTEYYPEKSQYVYVTMSIKIILDVLKEVPTPFLGNGEHISACQFTELWLS